MKSFFILSVVAAFATGVSAHGEEEVQEMGPVALLWPPDRLWGAAYDNIAPCGSSSGVVNRTQFPLVNGQLALVIQDEAWNVQVSISHKNNPTSNDDFEAFVDASRIPDVDPGHECYPVPNPSIDAEEGMNATFQIKYTSEFDTDKNETYYACADVTYIPTSKFTFQVPCFNVTADEFTATNSSSPSSDDDDSDSTGSSAKENSESTKQESSSGLSGGAIAGIVIGSVAAVAIGVCVLFGYRRLLQKYRSARQKASVRNVDWAEGTTRAVNSDQSSLGHRKAR